MSDNWISVDRSLGLFLVVAGLVQCFFGHRIIKVSVALSCFLGSFALVQLASELLSLSRSVALGTGLMLGLLAVWTVHRAYRMGVFCVGAMAGALVARSVAALFKISALGFIGICIPVVFGLLALSLEGAALAISTSVAGAGLVASGFNSVRLGAFDLSQLSVVEIVVGLGFGVFGFVKQKK